MTEGSANNRVTAVKEVWTGVRPARFLIDGMAGVPLSLSLSKPHAGFGAALSATRIGEKLVRMRELRSPDNRLWD